MPMKKFPLLDKVLKELEIEFNKSNIRPVDEIQKVLDELSKGGFPYKKINPSKLLFAK